MNKPKNNLEKIISFKKDKLANLINNGINPYPHSCSKGYKISELLIHKDKILKSSEQVITCGRIISSRDMGKSSFINSQGMMDSIQLYVSKEGLGADYDTIYKNTDVGDIIEVKNLLCSIGFCIKTYILLKAWNFP